MKSETYQDLSASKYLALPILKADTFSLRAFGLLRYRKPPPFGLWLTPCNAIHTWGMNYAIDLVWLDKNHQVLGIQHALKPWRFCSCPTAKSVIELPEGHLRKHPIQLNQSLEILCAASS